MNPLRITFISRANSPHAGGMERFSYELVSQFQRLPDVQAHTVIYRGYRLLTPLFLFTGLFSAFKYARKSDVIHIGDPTLSMLGFLIKHITRKPVVVTVHGLDISYPFFLYQLYLKLFFRNFDRYFPISRHVKQLLVSRFNPPSDKIIVLRPGINDQYYAPQVNRSHLNKLLNRNTKHDFIILTVGRLVARKGHAWFISHVLPHLPDNVIYIIAGKGPESDNITQSTQDQNLAHIVIQLGRVSESDLQTLYNTCDAFAQPNIPVDNDHEGYGLVLIEAALCGLPVFASDMEGMQDAVTDGQNGTLLPPQSPREWITAINNHINTPWQPSQAATVRDYSKQHHTWPHLIQRYISAFKSVVT